MTITINWADILYDARANSWKTGRIAPREDGLHGETQMSSDKMDTNIAKRFFTSGMGFLLEVVKDFLTPGTTPVIPSDPRGASGAGTIPDNSQWTIDVTPNSRNNADGAQASALAHAFVLAYMMSSWYRLVEPRREKGWADRMENARVQLLGALRYKKEPE